MTASEQRMSSVHVRYYGYLMDLLDECNESAERWVLGYLVRPLDIWLFSELASTHSRLQQAFGLFDGLPSKMLFDELKKYSSNVETCKQLAHLIGKDYGLRLLNVAADGPKNEPTATPEELVDKLIEISLKEYNNDLSVPGGNEVRYMYPPLGNTCLVDVYSPRPWRPTPEQKQALLDMIREERKAMREAAASWRKLNQLAEEIVGGG